MDEHTPDSSSANQRQKAIKRKAREEAEDFKWLLSSRRGRRIVWRQLERTGVFRSSFNNNSMAMAFAEGQRNYGLQVLAQVHAHRPEAYALMVSENNDDDNRNTDDSDAPTDQ